MTFVPIRVSWKSSITSVFNILMQPDDAVMPSHLLFNNVMLGLHMFDELRMLAMFLVMGFFSTG